MISAIRQALARKQDATRQAYPRPTAVPVNDRFENTSRAPRAHSPFNPTPTLTPPLRMRQPQQQPDAAHLSEASQAARGTPLRTPPVRPPRKYRGIIGMGRVDTLLWGAVVISSVVMGLTPVLLSVANLAAGPVVAALGGVLALLASSVGALRWREARRQKRANAETLARRPAMTVQP